MRAFLVRVTRAQFVNYAGDFLYVVVWVRVKLNICDAVGRQTWHELAGSCGCGRLCGAFRVAVVGVELAVLLKIPTTTFLI